ncbi:MAG: hypothetical protein IPG50_12245 [Myxococcales bacterium]|nr:hypothetical protein [Myxococcales bacterium]
MRVAWEKGGEADLEVLTESRVVLVSTRSSPPGSRIDGTLRLSEDSASEGASSPVRFKIHSCRREGERFRLEGRPIDITRELLERVRAALPAKPE